MHKVLHPAPLSRARVLVLSVKAYVATAWFVSEFYTQLAGRFRDSNLPEILWYGYGLAFIVLAADAWLKHKHGDRIGSLFSVMWGIAALVLSMFCLPVLSKP